VNQTLQAPSLLAAADRCDRCGAQAFVRVLLPSGSDLLFCGHHAREHEQRLREVAVEYQDETARLTESQAPVTQD
jgi:hypothetical protein